MRGIFIAVEIEARSLIAKLGLKPERDKPFKVYSGSDTLLVITGIGKANMAMAVTFAAVTYELDECINCGAAGALKHGLPPGSVYPVEKIYEPDRPLLTSDKPRIHKPFMPAGMTGVILSTMDKPVIDNEQRRSASELADLADMEGAAFVQACRRFSLRAFVYKLVTDIPGSSKEDIIKNIIKYEKNLADYYTALAL